MAEKISIREFSRRVGCSDTAVLKAIKAEKIVKALDYTNPKRPTIDPEIALKEWGKNYDPSYERTSKSNENMGSVIASPNPKAVQKPNRPADQEQEDTPPQGGKSLADIKRQTAEIKLHEAALDLKQKRGELVNKDKVYKALFAAGQEVRSKFEAIPDRVIDDVLAARSRNESHQVLYNAIADALEELSKIVNRDLNV